MRLVGLACCAVVACKGTREDDRNPAPAPIAPAPPADASTPDAATCFAVDTPAAEQAGIRRLAHRASHEAAPRRVPLDVVLLEVGKPTPLVGFRAAKEPLVRVPPIGADALATMAKLDAKKQVVVTAPAHLEGAVVRLASDKASVLGAIGGAGVATYARFVDVYANARRAQPQDKSKGELVTVTPDAIFADDIDGDGAPELVVYGHPLYGTRGRGMEPGGTDEREIEIGVLWASGEVASIDLCCELALPSALYLVSPAITGGPPQIVALDGTRFTLNGKTLELAESLKRTDGKLCF